MKGQEIFALSTACFILGFATALFFVWLGDLKRDAEKWREQ